MVDGSTSTHPLQRKLACDIFNAAYTWSEQTTTQQHKTIIPDMSKAIPEDIVKKIMGMKPSGTHGAYVNLINPHFSREFTLKIKSKTNLF